MPRKNLIQLRRDVSSNWEAINPVLALSEVGVETDTSRFKIGDGETAWTRLPYAGAPLGSSSGLVVKTSTGGELTTIPQGTTSQFLRGDGTYAPLAIEASAGRVITTVSGGKLSALDAGTTSQFLRGDGTWQTITPSNSGSVSQINGTVTTASSSSKVVRNITLSTSGPFGGSDGDVWMVYV